VCPFCYDRFPARSMTLRFVLIWTVLAVAGRLVSVSSSATPSPVRTGAAHLGRSIVVMGGLLVLLWALEGFDTLIGGRLDWYGIHARDVDGLPGILTAPLLHAGWGQDRKSTRLN